MLSRKTAHFRLSSVAQKRRSLKLPNNSSMDHKEELRQKKRTRRTVQIKLRGVYTY